MDCPACKIKIACVDSVSTGKNTFRKYRCSSCGEEVYTYEQVNEAAKIALGLLRGKQRRRNKEYKNPDKAKKKQETAQQRAEEQKRLRSLRKEAFEKWGDELNVSKS